MRRLAGFAESAVLAADGIVGEDARLAFEKILQREPGRPEPRFWLALAKEQDGRLADALADYKALLSEAPAEAPWRQTVEGRIAEVSRRIAGSDKGAPQAPGPRPRTWRRLRGWRPKTRARMIAQMVDGLAERLKRDGRDLAGWQRLINAYAVLGRGRTPAPRWPTRARISPPTRKRWPSSPALAKTGSHEELHRRGSMTRKQRRAVFIVLQHRRPDAGRAARGRRPARHHRLLPHAQGGGREAYPGRQAHPPRRPRGRGQPQARRRHDGRVHHHRYRQDHPRQLHRHPARPLPRGPRRGRRRQARRCRALPRRHRARQARRELHAPRGRQGPQGARRVARPRQTPKDRPPK